jgi:hypothetical protein
VSLPYEELRDIENDVVAFASSFLAQRNLERLVTLDVRREPSGCEVDFIPSMSGAASARLTARSGCPEVCCHIGPKVDDLAGCLSFEWFLIDGDYGAVWWDTEMASVLDAVAKGDLVVATSPGWLHTKFEHTLNGSTYRSFALGRTDGNFIRFVPWYEPDPENTAS